MRIQTIAGAAAVAALIATPAMAQTQQQFAGPQQQRTDSTGAMKVKKMHQTRFGESRASYEDRQSGFWPVDVAAGVVGGAIGAAGAIATAPFTPFRGDSFAYYRDANTGRGYIADGNGPTCLPGRVTTINGQPMRCQ